MPIGKFLYFGDFAVIPIAVLLFAGVSFVNGGLAAAPDWLLSLIVGAVLWTLVEYVIHRFVYHAAPILTPLHHAHHREPTAYVGVPSFVSSGLIIVVCYLPLRFVDPIVASGFTSGMLLGYAGYMVVHHATHHFKIEPGDWLYEARVRHMAHHYHDDANFGVSVGFWDWVFRTRGARRDRAARERTAKA
jgi:sterol desaturase/sphingolipid hydroxylase (fatty acid hydroxylase superfamily)